MPDINELQKIIKNNTRFIETVVYINIVEKKKNVNCSRQITRNKNNKIAQNYDGHSLNFVIHQADAVQENLKI